jgi:hypothetical protein
VRSGGVLPRRLPTAPRSRAPGVTVARLFRRVPPGFRRTFGQAPSGGQIGVPSGAAWRPHLLVRTVT